MTDSEEIRIRKKRTKLERLLSPLVMLKVKPVLARRRGARLECRERERNAISGGTWGRELFVCLTET
jgi:hypothetical protein